MAWFGIFLILLAVFLTFTYRGQTRRLHLLQDTPTSTVEHLRKLSASMSEGLGQGTLSYLTEVRGTVRCAEPLVSELAKVSCVYYSMRVSREYEETVTVTDPQGRRQRRTQRGSETVSSNQRSTPFEIEDSTGRIRVDPGGAKMVTERSLSRFEPGQQALERLRLGGVSLDLPFGFGGGRRTLGYRLEEEVIPVDRSIYVLAEATDQYGELLLRSPQQSGRFIISLKGEGQLVSELESKIKMTRFGAIGAGLLGVALMLGGLFGY